jgi:hypothetical protein
MKTSLLVLSLLMASTNAIDIKTVPVAIPEHAKAAAPHEVEKVAKKAAVPKASDHKVDTPEHHVKIVAKGHNDLKKAAAVKAPKVAKTDDDKDAVVAKAPSAADAKFDSHE